MNITNRILNAYQHPASFTQLPEVHGLENNISVLIIWSTVGSGFSREVKETNQRTIENHKRSDISLWQTLSADSTEVIPFFSLDKRIPFYSGPNSAARWILLGVSPAQPSHSSLIEAFPAFFAFNSADHWDKNPSPLGEDIYSLIKDENVTKWCNVTLWHLYLLKIRFLLPLINCIT